MKKAFAALAVLLIIVAAFVGGYLYGQHNTAAGRDGSGEDVVPMTFYAEIEAIENNDVLLVSGLDVNDINFRGKFRLFLQEDTKVEWRYTDIELSDLKSGARISVTFTGMIREISPAEIDGVTRIILLDDEY